MSAPRYLPPALLLLGGLLLAAPTGQAQTLSYNQATRTATVNFNPAADLPGFDPSATYGLGFQLTSSQGAAGQMTSFLGTPPGLPGAILDSQGAGGNVQTSSVFLNPGAGLLQTGYLVQAFTFNSPISFTFTFSGIAGNMPQPDTFYFDVYGLGGDCGPTTICGSLASAGVELQPAAVPEPGTLLLVGMSGLGVLGAVLRRRRAVGAAAIQD